MGNSSDLGLFPSTVKQSSSGISPDEKNADWPQIAQGGKYCQAAGEALVFHY